MPFQPLISGRNILVRWIARTRRRRSIRSMRSVILLLLSSLCSVSARATDTPQNPAHLVTQPLRFEKDGDAFIARGAGFSFRLLPGLMEMTAGGSVTASLQGASPVRPEGLDSQGVANYFRGNSPQNWRTGIPVFAKVRYRSVYRSEERRVGK